MPKRPLDQYTGAGVTHIGDIIHRLTRRHVMMGATAAAISGKPVRAAGRSLARKSFDPDDADQVAEALLRMNGIPLDKPAYSWVIARVFSDQSGHRTALYDECSVISAFHEASGHGTRHIQCDSITEMRVLETEQPLRLFSDPKTQCEYSVPVAQQEHFETDLEARFRQVSSPADQEGRTSRSVGSVVCADGLIHMTYNEEVTQANPDTGRHASVHSEQKTFQAREAELKQPPHRAISSSFTYSSKRQQPDWMSGDCNVGAVQMLGMGGAVQTIEDLPGSMKRLACQLG